MAYKIVNKQGRNWLQRTFKTKKQAETAKKNKEKIVGKLTHSRIVKIKPKKRTRSLFGW